MYFLETEITFPAYTPPTAWFEHGPFAMWLVRAMKPARIVELGCHHGFSYFAMCEAVKAAGLPTSCFAVDTWTGDEHSGFYDESVYETIVAENRQYESFSKLLRKTFAEALEDVEDGSVDLLHVDGRHFYEDVREDFESWIPKLSNSAVVLFHDTEIHERDFGVHRYWSEISAGRPSLNFRHCAGLGVLFWGEEIAEGLRDFVGLASERTGSDAVAALFEALGAKARSDHALVRGEGAAEQAETIAALNGEVEELRGEKARFEARNAEAMRRFEEQVSEISNLRLERDDMARQFNKLRRELAEARQKPWKSLRRKQVSRLLYFLSERHSLFSERRREKFRISAGKRDPGRSLAGLASDSISKSADAVLLQKGRAGAAPDGRGERFERTVMVVSHDTTRTGAPILALNLIRELGTRYNVVAVALGGGELAPDFLSECSQVLKLDRRLLSAEALTRELVSFIEKNDISMAFVNSVEGRFALPALKTTGVPSVALLHEFAANTRPRSAFPDVFAQADHVVFSTGITLDNALNQPGAERPLNVHILPQGKCESRSSDRIPDEAERRWLDSVLRPNGAEDREFVVIGAGTIETRKGIDLFIETATRVIAGPGGGDFRFVWIGHGYDPERDTRSSVYLADQIERAGIQTQVRIVRATSEIEYAYDLADMMVISSRLDPLPNVAIDMLLAGKPVMCFDRTTGIADFLDDAGLREDCVASYIDTSEMAAKIRALAENPARRREVADRGTERAKQVFDFPSYTQALEKILSSGGRKIEQVEGDLARIRESGAFRGDFYHPPGSKLVGEDQLVRHYLETNRSGPHLRKPMPGFNQLVYAEETGWGRAQDPFVEFLEAGQPDGRWKSMVIDETSPIDEAALDETRVALHVHAFFVEEFRDILARLDLNHVRPTLFVSAPDSRIDAVREALEAYKGPVGELAAVPNRGRDIGPFLTRFGAELVSGFDIVGHMHTKRSNDVGDRRVIETWVEFLLENTLGGQRGGRMLDRIVTSMVAAPDLGIVYPDDPGIVGWSANRAHAERLAARMGIGDLPDHFSFPMGTMFWARASLIRSFVELELDWSDYPPEPLPYDGSLLHAMERMFGVVPAHLGLRTGVTNIRGLTR